ncbi:sigma-70 family RNA polymerase sigma factor [Halodesulfovibrio marinisediminis]|uniref:RNA polymerase sigma-70 factor, ECF subfamily n=1 Tax=Halodesulfovibrio marinisediminis DSM 17456 TaxID=1121457 RepID=A0A1N6GTI2_9BACT|nr:sigma-70 family RNA polymerase sigma factor [Halodesulfovibrio marinisediminis]SIO10890.1 RNA polymerase sigma-70 factor, ECF subfamily [Halodesulfovibrio marinisediminis DSM 17456]
MKQCLHDKISVDVYNDFFVDHTSLIKRTIVSVLKKFNSRIDANVVDDIYQNVALKIIKNNYLERYDSKKAKLSSWIYVIVESSIIDDIRKQQKHKTETLDETFAIGVTTHFFSVRNYIPKSLLTERQMEILILTIEKDYSTKEASTVLSLSESAVRCMKHQALRRLRNYYTKYDSYGGKHDH